MVTTAATGLDLSDLDVSVLLNPDDDVPGTNPALAERGDIVEVKIS